MHAGSAFVGNAEVAFKQIDCLVLFQVDPGLARSVLAQGEVRFLVEVDRADSLPLVLKDETTQFKSLWLDLHFSFYSFGRFSQAVALVN